jgi:hypothetical protein
MEQALIVIALFVIAAVLIFYLWQLSKQNKKRILIPGIRREAALERHVPKANRQIFKREVISGGRRFFFDVEEGERGKYLRISELEKSTAGKEKAFTLLIFEREILGFQRALNEAVEKMAKSPR